MTFNLMELLYKSNIDLKQRNKNTSEIIVDLENHLLDILKEYDYSNLFRDCLNQVNTQLSNLNGDIFDELIDLINRVYEN